MSDFRERYNHYMEMYKLSPPSVMDRRVSWAGGEPVLCNYDHHRRHRGGTGSVELCSQVDNLLHQVHNAQQMLKEDIDIYLCHILIAFYDNTYFSIPMLDPTDHDRKRNIGCPNSMQCGDGKSLPCFSPYDYHVLFGV
jgi:hypothetical protein